MNADTRQPASPSEDPAEQPKEPGGDCEHIENSPVPTVPEPEKCEPKCECPHPPVTTPTCLDDLIARQSRAIAEAERAEAFKSDLEAMLAKSKTAQAEYTQEKYDELVRAWQRNDDDIVTLIRKLVCAVPCWECIIECHVCPLLEEVRYREAMLYGDRTLPTEVKSLHDLRHWHERRVDAERARYERIRGVLAAWETPAQTIEKINADNAKLISDSEKFIGSGATKVVYDVFLKLVPLHLAIAPPASSGVVTGIAGKYTAFCECDVGEPDDCCGPDVGRPSLQQRLIGSQPYLVMPSDYFTIICCLTEQRYLPAKDALSSAESGFAEVDGLIKRFKAEIDDAMTPQSFENTVKAGLPADCKWWEDRDACQTEQEPDRSAS